MRLTLTLPTALDFYRMMHDAERHRHRRSQDIANELGMEVNELRFLKTYLQGSAPISLAKYGMTEVDAKDIYAMACSARIYGNFSRDECFARAVYSVLNHHSRSKNDLVPVLQHLVTDTYETVDGFAHGNVNAFAIQFGKAWNRRQFKAFCLNGSIELAYVIPYLILLAGCGSVHNNVGNMNETGKVMVDRALSCLEASFPWPADLEEDSIADTAKSVFLRFSNTVVGRVLLWVCKLGGGTLLVLAFGVSVLLWNFVSSVVKDVARQVVCFARRSAYTRVSFFGWALLLAGIYASGEWIQESWDIDVSPNVTVQA
jgi:hypothetical protein